MGCGHCGNETDGRLPLGCKNNGTCASGACNRLNVYDWLNDITVTQDGTPFPYVEVSFNQGSRKDYYRLSNDMTFSKGDYVTVEGVGGYDVGVVSAFGEIARLQVKRKKIKIDDREMRKVLRPSNSNDIARLDESKKLEKDVLLKARTLAKNLHLEMKIAEVEIQADGKKATYFYTADDRVDFRELIKRFSTEFQMRVEMKQIGIRQEAAKVGGIGSCGRELCCSTWLTRFQSVSTAAARYQNLAINQLKLSGQCGRLKCCLNYELDTYMDALRVFPTKADRLETTAGIAFLQKRDIFKNLMWYSYKESNKLYPLSIERVKQILTENAKGVKAEDLKPVELKSSSEASHELPSEELVGQISLASLDKRSKQRKKTGNKKRNQRRNQPPPSKPPKNTNKS